MAAEAAAPTPDKAGLIELEMAARLLMVSGERVRQLVKAGYIAKPAARGRYNLVAVVQGYIRFLKDEERRTSKSAADSRVRDARAREIEMRNDERMRKLIPAEDATAALDYLAGQVGEALGSIPARVTRDIELRRTIEAEVNAAKETIAKALAASADVVEKGGDLPHSSATD